MKKNMKRCLSLFLSFVMILSLCPVTVLADKTTTDADNNVVVSYDFEELTSDGLVTDISGNGYHGTIQTGASVEDGVAVMNNGSKTGNDTAGILIPTESFAGLENYTIQMDMKIAASTFQYDWVQIFTTGTGADHKIEMTNQGFSSSVDCGVSVWGKTAEYPNHGRVKAAADKLLPQDEWGRWTYTQSGNVGTLYLDGVKVVSGEFNITLADMAVDGSKAAIGAIVTGTGVQSITGNIDNFVIYNEAKSAAEILKEYKFDYEIVVSYDFEELTADGLVTDISGNGYHGTIQTGASVEGGVAVMDNGSKTGNDTAGILIPTESFAGLTDYTIQMDMKIAASTFQYNWVQIFTAGTGANHKIEMTHQGYSGGADCGVSIWGKTAEYPSHGRVKAAADKLLPQDEWGRWTYTQSGNIGTFYLDGIKVVSGEFNITLADMAVDGSKAAIGAIVTGTADQSITGNIDNFVLYNEAKSAAEILEEYEYDYDVVVSYDFEEVTGDGIVTDTSGNGYHGTIQTGASVKDGVAVMNNGSKTGNNTAGILIPTESFAGLTDYTIQMDMKVAASTFQYDWVQIFTAGTGSEHKLEMTNQGYSSSVDCGVSVWGKKDGTAANQRLKAAADKLLPQDEWGRWTYTQSGNVGTFYLDGIEVVSGEFNITLADMAVEGSKAAIGAIVTGTNDRSITGNIDNFVLYNEAKSAEEIYRSFAEDYSYMAIKIEAESAVLTSPATVKSSSTASGGSKVGSIDNTNATVTFELRVPESGTYVVEVVADGYPASYPNPGHAYWVNDDIDNKQSVFYTKSTNWNVWNSYFIQVDLNAGKNTLTFSQTGIAKSYAEMDYIVLYQDIDETKEKINIAFDLNYTVEDGYAEAIFSGTGGKGSIITFNGKDIMLGTQKIEEVAVDGVYHVNADIDHAQQMVMITLTMPNGTEVQRGNFGFLNGITNVDRINVDTSGTVENVEITYPEPAKNTATVPTAGTTAFDSEAYNLVTSIIDDAKTTRGFAWTAKTSHTNMVIEYAKADADFETAKIRKTAQYISKYSLLYYEVDVEGLEPGTKYAYRIGDTADDIWSSTYYFTTEAEDVTDFSFVAITDSQRIDDFLYLRQTVATAMQEDADASFLMNVGDIVEWGTQESQWTNYFAKLKGYLEDVPHVPVAGNHEYDTTPDGETSTGGERFGLHFNNPDNGGAAAIGDLTVDDVTTTQSKNVIKNIKDTIYSFDYGNAHFAVLNSGAYQGGAAGNYGVDSTIIIEAQKEWLKKDLNSSDQQWKIVVIHQGVYDSITDWDAPIADVVEECGVDLVISGHTHDYSRSYPMKGTEISSKTNQDVLVKGEGAIYQVIGNVTNNSKSSTAIEVQPELYTYSNSAISEPTYTIYDFSETELRVVTKQLDGYVVDSFTISDETVKSKYNASIDKAAAEYTLGDTSAVISPLTLAEKYGDISITWTTSDASVVDKDGSITRSTSSDGTATLTATFSRVGTSYTKKVAFEVTVLKIADTTELQTAVAAGKEKLTRPLSSLYYEEEAWANYIATIREGELVLYNQEFVQQEVNAVLDKIAEAEKALTEKLYTLNVTGGVISGKDGEDATTAAYTAMQDATITAERLNGDNVFSYWAYDAEGTQIASYGRTFTFFMIKDMNLYAIYKPEGEVEEVVSVTANAVYDAELDKVVVTIRRTAPLDCVIVEHGILVTKDGSVALTVDNVGDIVKGVRKTDENGLPVNGLATVKVNLAYGENCYACGYVIYIDADGNRVTKYSEIVNAGKQGEDSNVEEGTGFGDETTWPT